MIMDFSRKTCKKCREHLTKDMFSKNGKSLRRICKNCTNEERRLNYKLHKQSSINVEN